MKIAESWLREWVDPDLDSEALGQQLTMAGHEVNEITIQGAGLDGIIVAEIVNVAKHPDADRLSVCKVATGKKVIDVVCGAANVLAGMKSPLATPGLTLPNGIKLRKTRIRGVVSNGMLCSAVELGLGDEADGIIALPDDAPVGAALTAYLKLPDTIIDLDLTPNRGDCFSVLGIARDVSAMTGASLKSAEVPAVAATIEDVHEVKIKLPEGCPSFAGRVIRNIDLSAKSPGWMVERLRRAGLREIHAVVDITNYVMLELGQPLHAYDLGLVQGPIRPRLAKRGDKVTLLDEKEISVNKDTLVIADNSGAIGLAGIMGGLSTAVSEKTVDVFFEAAFWPPEFMAGRARSYGLHTDASLRFERGVDPEGQVRAVERATALLLAAAGGDAGPLVHHVDPNFLPMRETVTLRRSRLAKLLGLDIEDGRVSAILTRLGFEVNLTDDGWDVAPPSYRFDIEAEVDLIEEIARVHGYDSIPETTAITETPLAAVTESCIDLEQAAATLVARDYQEVITYSFIDAGIDKLFSGIDSELVLSNPISSEMAVMRASLWPGMIAVAAANAARQQDRVRLFEVGKSFHGSELKRREVLRIAGLATGPAHPEQWGSQGQPVDFFDIKSDVAALLRLSGDAVQISYEPSEHVALQPGQAAKIVRDGSIIGILGKLHPSLAKTFDLRRAVYIFELDAMAALASAAPQAIPVSKYPAIRRDIAVVVDDKISVDELVRAVSSTVPNLIQEVRIFDVYKGPGIEAGLKSVALGLILQETSRTLTDDDADSAMTKAVRKLQEKFAAELRD
jgi:phenylalanyl-tRNA synthetase beta chain